MKKSILICSDKYSGCGHIGYADEWTDMFGDGNNLSCPHCLEDHAFQITEDNINMVTSEWNRDEARELLKQYRKVI